MTIPATMPPPVSVQTVIKGSHEALGRQGDPRLATRAHHRTRRGLDDQKPQRRPPHNTWEQVWNAAVEAGARVVTYLKLPLMPVLDPDRKITGYVVAAEEAWDIDGDADFVVAPLPRDRDVLIYRGKYRPLPPAILSDDWAASGDWALPPAGRGMLAAGAINIEVKSTQRQQLSEQIDRLRKLAWLGKTPLVSVRGKWTYDAFHQGWVEIHPVRDLVILSEDYRADRPALGR